MVVLALIALAVAAAAPAVAAALGPLSRGRLEVPEWASSVVALPALGVAALASTRTTPVTGFALGATLVLCVLAAATAGAPLVLATFKIARRQPDGSPAPDAGPLRGGRVIGILERLAVAASILATWPEGIAIVLAVKGLARYPELREPHASEQFIMGTFVSVLWAIAVCGTGRGTQHVGDECPSRSTFATRGVYWRWPPSGGCPWYGYFCWKSSRSGGSGN